MADKTYVVRTFGCQMNEHDSERIAGLLEADGLRPAVSVDDADVVVLNTCCIRENADNKLYGNLGQLKALKQRRPDMQIVVGGCLAQKDRDLIIERAPHVDVVFGTHNVHRAAELLGEQRRAGRSLVEILEETAAEDHDTFPSALPARREVAYAGWVTIQIGCDNSCAFCIVPAVRGREISRPFDDIVRRGPGARRRRGHRGDAARPEREQLRPRPHAGPAAGGRAGAGPAAVRRPAAGGGRGRGHPPGPLHQPPPQGPAARDHRGHGRGSRGVRAPPPAAAGGQRSSAGRHAPGLHRRALPRAPGRGPGGHAGPGGDHRHHRGLPG